MLIYVDILMKICLAWLSSLLNFVHKLKIYKYFQLVQRQFLKKLNVTYDFSVTQSIPLCFKAYGMAKYVHFVTFLLVILSFLIIAYII